MTDLTDLLTRRDAISRSGQRLLASTHIESALTQHGDVYPSGSFFLDLALRPEIDLLLLVCGPVEPVIEAVAATMVTSLSTSMVQHIARSASNDKSLVKHFLVATSDAPPEVSGRGVAKWIIDVAIWERESWEARFGPPGVRHRALANRLMARDRELVLQLKAALIERDLADSFGTWQLCNAVLSGRVMSPADIDNALDIMDRGTQ